MEEPFSNPPALGELSDADTVHRMEQAPLTAGWYPDPAGSGSLRYFDGRSWTSATQTEHVTDPGRIAPAFSTPAFAQDTLSADSAFLSPPSSTPELQVPWGTTMLRLIKPRQSGVQAFARLIGTLCLVVSVSTLGYALWENRFSAWTAAQAQSDLRSEFASEVAARAQNVQLSEPQSTKSPVTVTPTTTQPTAPTMPLKGELAGHLVIPGIDLDKMILVGTDSDTLAKGPGVWQSGVMPGAPGNSTISGHRTTHGGPFRHLDRLKVGDRITFEVPGEARAVFEVRGIGKVSPQQIEVTGQGPGVRLTLTTCDPPGSAARRLVVQAELVEGTFLSQALPAQEWAFRGE